MQVAFGLYPGLTMLDFVGPYQVFSNVPGIEVVVCAEHTGRLDDDNRLLHLDIEHTFADVTAPDITIVPGGFVTRRLARDDDPIVSWILDAHATTTYTASVCTGALLLGAAGLLDGLDATTHWCAYDELASYGARPTEQRIVRNGKIWTAAGVSAGRARNRGRRPEDRGIQRSRQQLVSHHPPQRVCIRARRDNHLRSPLRSGDDLRRRQGDLLRDRLLRQIGWKHSEGRNGEMR